jgi:hypothetical protein
MKCEHCGKELKREEAWIGSDEYWKTKYPSEKILKCYCEYCAKLVNSKKLDIRFETSSPEVNENENT